MTDEKETAPPTVAELEGKVSRLATQVDVDTKALESVTTSFKAIVKSGDVDKALEVAADRTAVQATLVKSTSQLKTAKAAVTSANFAASAEKIADIHNRVRDGKLSLTDAFGQLEALGVTKLTVERSEETGKLIINSAGPNVKRARAGGSGGGGKGSPLTVDGETFDSAAAALAQHRPDFEGKMGRSAIVSWLTNAGHEVA